MNERMRDVRDRRQAGRQAMSLCLCAGNGERPAAAAAAVDTTTRKGYSRNEGFI